MQTRRHVELLADGIGTRMIREACAPIARRRRWVAVFAAVAIVLSSVPEMAHTTPTSAAADLQDGDFLVGVTVDLGFGGTEGRVVRVRNGQASVFCAPVSHDPQVPGYWQGPSDVLIDAQGRVVFLSYLGTAFDTDYQWGFGLWRCDSMGATPTLLGAFGSDQSTPPLNYPSPLGSRDIRRAGGLHLKRTKGVDLSTLTMAESQFYVLAVADSDAALAEAMAYNPTTENWTDAFVDPVPTDQPGTSAGQIDMINANGYTFSVSGGSLRTLLEPISLDFQIGEFTGGVAFQSLHDLANPLVDDSHVPNTRPSNCPDHSDGVSLNYPNGQDGYTLNSLSAVDQIAWSDGFVLQSNSVGTGYAFLPNISLVLFDLYPNNDLTAMYHEEFQCTHQKKLDFTPWHAPGSYSDSHGTLRSVDSMAPGGTAGTQPGFGRIVGVGSSDDVAILAEGLNNPRGIDVYPGFMPPIAGISFFIQVESPVSVLITGPDGRRLGVDPTTDLFVNDYGDGGYDSQTNEPHIYGIREPMPGDFTIQTKGTGSGPFTIKTYGTNLGTEAITLTSFQGVTSPGQPTSHGILLGASGLVMPDADIDGIADSGDNCPLMFNPFQLNTDATNSGANRAGADALGDACDDDVDGDGYTNIEETTPPLIEDPLMYCNIMRADVDGDGAVSILDLTHVAQYFTQTVPPAPERHKQDGDNKISILDLTRMAQVFTQPVSACP